MDLYPYPNDPGRAPVTGVTRTEAAARCEARGRRLCTDLEWERVCRGPSGTKYENGERFDSFACPGGGAGKSEPRYEDFPKCASAFGPKAMHGFGWEWTASEWKRGEEKGAGVLRGSSGAVPYATGRCAAARRRMPDEPDAKIGFRCCGGPRNDAEVEVEEDLEPGAPIDEERALSPELAARYERALGHAGPPPDGGVFTRAFRWHPAPREELVVARRERRDDAGKKAVMLYVIRLCERAVYVVAKLRGPVDRMTDPADRKGQPQLLTASVGTGEQRGEVRLLYQYGEVAVEQPAWISSTSE